MSVVDTLEALVAAAPGVETEDLEVVEPAGDRLAPGAWRALEKRYAKVVEDVVRAWGQPEFNGTWNDPHFPAWHHRVAHLAYWRRGSVAAYVECDHQDNELPAVLCVGALTEAEQAALIEENAE